MRVKAWIPLLALVAAMLGGCTMSDEDRCASGYFYVPEIKVCCPDYDEDSNEVLWDTEAKQCIAQIPVDTDVPTDTEEGPEGLGDECQADADCAGQESSFCAVNPLEQVGMCTPTNCTPELCTAGFQCCDCTASGILPKEKVCLFDEWAALAASAGGCTCAD